jgi:ornithine cyclodeaminase/alanine dehydrogenase-like protein (mu-crystallin family)
VPPIPVLGHDAVLAAVTPADAIDHVREGFRRHRAGEWSMPAKVYLQSPPFGDFRAMPALGDGLALLKWITSFPSNPERDLPTVQGLICLSDAETGTPLMILDARSVTALRTGAVAAVAARALARADAHTIGVIGCGLHGLWAARCMRAAGYAGGVACDPRTEPAQAVARELDGTVGERAQALACDVVCCVTPGTVAIVERPDLRPGLHLNMLGADGPGKAEATVHAVAACTLFCDEWEQAVHGGELTGAVSAGLVDRDAVRDLGSVLAAAEPRGRSSDEEITLFDSTGLAIQDLAIAAAAYRAWRAGAVPAQTIDL